MHRKTIHLPLKTKEIWKLKPTTANHSWNRSVCQKNDHKKIHQDSIFLQAHIQNKGNLHTFWYSRIIWKSKKILFRKLFIIRPVKIHVGRQNPLSILLVHSSYILRKISQNCILIKDTDQELLKTNFWKKEKLLQDTGVNCFSQGSRLCLSLTLFHPACDKVHEHSHADLNTAQNIFNQHSYIQFLQKQLRKSIYNFIQWSIPFWSCRSFSQLHCHSTNS